MMVEDRPKPPAAVAGVGYLQLQQAGLARTRRARRARSLSPPKQEQEQGAAARTRRPVSDIRERRRVRPARSRVCRLGAEQDVTRGEKKCKRGPDSLALLLLLRVLLHQSHLSRTATRPA
jgi:hypothetical protein